MKRFFKTINFVFTALLISIFSVAGHAAAMPAGSHGAMKHEANSSVGCATIFLSTAADKKREVPVYDEKDDEPEPPYYLQFESAQTGWFAEKSLVARSIEEPGKIPKYQLCCVMRR